MASAGSILCVDDEILLVMSLKLELSAVIPPDMSVLTAITRDEALRTLDESLGEVPGIRLLITDWIIPGISGGELIDRARTLIPLLPAIVMTGIARFENIGANIKSQGPLEIIPKPWNSRKLARIVLGMIGSDIAKSAGK